MRHRESLTQGEGSLVKDFTSNDLGKCLCGRNIGTGPIIQAFKRQQNDYKDNRVGRSLLSYISTLQRDNEKLRAIDKELKGTLWLLL